MTKSSYYRHDWTPEDRKALFWSKVDKRGPEDCWPWLGYVAPNGYGQFGGKTGTRLVHRIAYEYTVGPIAAGLMLDHLCHTRSPRCPGGDGDPHRKCCNPAHAQPVPARENIARGRGGDSWGYIPDPVPAKLPQLNLPVCAECGRTDKPIYKSGKCRPCYRRWLKDPDVKRPSMRTPEDRFWEKVGKCGHLPASRPDLGPCWLWTASLNQRTGYGQFFPVRGRPVDAHRFSYLLAKGAIPEKHDVHHLCLVRACVNPAHLEAVTRSENLRMRKNRRT